MVTGLQVADFHSVEQDQCLVEGPPAYTNIGLRPVYAALAHIDARNVLKQLRHAVGRRLPDLLFANHLDTSRLDTERYVHPVIGNHDLRKFNGVDLGAQWSAHGECCRSCNECN